MGDGRAVETAGAAGLLTAAAAEDRSGALWRLRGADRQLDANLVRHLPGARVAAHTEGDLDVMLVVVAGSGVLTLDGTAHPLDPGFLGLLPRGASRALESGPDGLSVLTVHRRRRGMSIGRPASGEPAAPRCPLHLVCSQCHRHAIEVTARFCSSCGTPLAPRAAPDGS
ncbi:hypothetical protein LG634_22095 [Streptomyces bambusae]|uniref:hypothetical protein n=1 Tax=Streptomyces bambusae TaxID=1550616 RepID=UPI001CFD133C|nr:hypothetical protein [Streptomyces bambusae]MCB5167508.1 hypothetical protein [Streptomyces bambusae]